jgi:hypothetical protein
MFTFVSLSRIALSMCLIYGMKIGIPSARLCETQSSLNA